MPTRLLGRYFGTPGWNEAEFTDAATYMFQYLFYPDDPEVEKKALDAAEKTRNYIDQTITARKSNRGQQDDVIERCLTLQDAGMPGMTDLDIIVPSHDTARIQESHITIGHIICDIVEQKLFWLQNQEDERKNKTSQIIR